MSELFLNLKEFLENKLWLNVIFFVLAIAGIIATILTSALSKRKKQLLYNHQSINFIEDQLKKIEGLEISYNGQKVDNLSASEIAIWNQGRGIINKNDFAKLKLLQIEALNDGEILQFETEYMKDSDNDFEVILNGNRKILNIYFDFLAKNDGIIIKILHTGKKELFLKVTGKVKGYGDIQKANLSVKDFRWNFYGYTILPILNRFYKLGIKEDGIVDIILTVILSILFLIPIVLLTVYWSIKSYIIDIPSKYKLQR